MKQIAYLKIVFISAFFVASFASVLLALQPQQALAAGCGEYDPEIAGPRMENIRKCIEEYQAQCREDFPDNKAKCNRLTDDQITECAQDSGRKLKRGCFQNLNNPNDDQNPAGGAISTEYDENDCKGSYEDLNGSNCGVLRYVLLITNVLSGIAGTVIVIMMIVGGIQYSMAGADATKVQAAKQKIYNALIALVLFIFGFAIIQWLVPGGLF